MCDFKMKNVETEEELNAVLDLCYSVLGKTTRNYTDMMLGMNAFLTGCSLWYML